LCEQSPTQFALRQMRLRKQGSAQLLQDIKVASWLKGFFKRT
jgi:hypothetical protein